MKKGIGYLIRTMALVLICAPVFVMALVVNFVIGD